MTKLNLKYIIILAIFNIISSCSNKGDSIKDKSQQQSDPDSTSQTTELGKKELSYAIDLSKSFVHGETVQFFNAICYNAPINLVFAKNKSEASLICSNKPGDFITFNYKTQKGPQDFLLQFNDFKFSRPELEKAFVDGSEYSIKDVIQKNSWYFNSNDNTIDAVFTHDPARYSNEEVNFSKQTISCTRNGKKVEISITDAGHCENILAGFLRFTFVK
jgi:hypothetical protein